MQKLMTVDGVAQLLDVHPCTVRDWAAAGRIPCVRVTRKCLRFKPEDIMEWAEKRTTGRRKIK